MISTLGRRTDSPLGDSRQHDHASEADRHSKPMNPVNISQLDLMPGRNAEAAGPCGGADRPQKNGS